MKKKKKLFQNGPPRDIDIYEDRSIQISNEKHVGEN